jgi:phosphoenolpyruvate synthase/pyruvate phosphate dikinase
VGSEELVHRPTALVFHVLEDVSVAPEGHDRVGVAEHLRDSVESHPLAEITPSVPARPDGIPAVVGTGEATRRLRDGQGVIVDGGVGVVEVDRR